MFDSRTYIYFYTNIDLKLQFYGLEMLKCKAEEPTILRRTYRKTNSLFFSHSSTNIFFHLFSIPDT
jgi:hypothetical protein